MKKASILLSFFLFSYEGSAFASSADECKKLVNAARSSLIEMMDGKKDEAQQKKVKDSANAVTSCLSEINVPAGKEGLVAELKKVWGEFKSTREDQLVPMILAGKSDDAKVIGTGIQKERLDKIKAIIQQLKGGDL